VRRPLFHSVLRTDRAFDRAAAPSLTPSRTFPSQPTYTSIPYPAAAALGLRPWRVGWSGVADGDTNMLLDGCRQLHKIRLAGIDAPEKAQPFGQRSKQHLPELAFGTERRLIVTR